MVPLLSPSHPILYLYHKYQMLPCFPVRVFLALPDHAVNAVDAVALRAL